MLGALDHAQASATAKVKCARKGNASGKGVDPGCGSWWRRRVSWVAKDEEAAAQFIAHAPPDLRVHYKRIVDKQRVKSGVSAAKKRVHSKAYSAAFRCARKEGKGAEEAKALARMAGTEATRAWTDLVGSWSDSTRAWSDISRARSTLCCVRER